jgi:hypothetical protein
MPGSFQLVPRGQHAALVRADYARMREMIFGDAPSWEQIAQGLQELEKRINGS